MQLAAFDGPSLKTSLRRKNFAKISYASRVIANFGDDQFKGFGLTEGQILPFPIYFKGRLYNSYTIV